MANPSVTHDYAATIAYLYGRINYEHVPADRPKKLNLNGMRLLLEHLGNPHLEIPVVHVAGTKGKGSTSSMIASVLTAAGYRTGLYTSPHLLRLEERFAVDGNCCHENDVVELTEQIRPVVEVVDRELKTTSPDLALTFFEITTAIAWLYFLRQQVDLAVLEVGMGGRLDSTNVCNPIVSVITSISFDHTKQLGNTLPAIAREKAGIIKAGVPVVSGAEQPEVRAVIQEVARNVGAPLYSLGEEIFVERHDAQSLTYTPSAESVNDHQRRLRNVFDYRDQVGWRGRPWYEVQVGLPGAHQIRNAALAIATLGLLNQRSWKIDENCLRSGLAKVRCPARIEVVRSNPTIILDTAHNVASAEALIETLRDEFPSGKRILIFAASRDKDIPGILRVLLPHFHDVVLTRFISNPRSATIEQLLRAAQSVIPSSNVGKQRITTEPSPVDAWNRCQQLLLPSDLLCITGSVFLAAELQPYVYFDSSSGSGAREAESVMTNVAKPIESIVNAGPSENLPRNDLI